MAKTSSLAFPNLFNISQNQVAVYEDNQSIVNRTRLLMLTEPKELYHNPDFGLGLKRHLWKYNNDNEKALIMDRLKDQLRLHEPYVDAERTTYANGLLFSGEEDPVTYTRDYNHLKMTIALQTTYNEVVEVETDILNSIQSE